MQGYQKRLIVEYFELSDRIEKLASYIDKYYEPSFTPKCELWVLERQLEIMDQYKAVLRYRLEKEGIGIDD